jgi:hypothetical protein
MLPLFRKGQLKKNVKKVVEKSIKIVRNLLVMKEVAAGPQI